MPCSDDHIHSKVTHVYKDGRMWYPVIPSGGYHPIRTEIARIIHQSYDYEDTYVRCDDGSIWWQPEGEEMWTQVEGMIR